MKRGVGELRRKKGQVVTFVGIMVSVVVVCIEGKCVILSTNPSPKLRVLRTTCAAP